MAIFYGFVLFSEFPDAFTWLGIFLIAGSGLFVFWRENRRKTAPRR
ncbi:MAG: LPXTG cell wall anchor domain-containing protein [Pseudomonadota bacterium]